MRPLPRSRELIPRWLFLRALGLIFFSAFYSFARQVHGLVGEQGILPARDYLAHVGSMIGGIARWWYVPSLFWISSSDRALTIGVVVGIVAALLLVANVAPRAMILICTVAYLSFVAVLQDFSSYQSDGMLLEAGFISIFFAPSGLRPGLGASDPPTTLSLFMLRWEWFRIYFESGLVKILSGDRHWRDFTAMDNYYQNGPLPAWPGWYVQHFPHWYHALTVGITFAIELFIVWAVFLPRRFRLLCFVAVTALQIGIITTANYAFLNYLVLVLGFLLLDDRVFEQASRRPWTAILRRFAPQDDSRLGGHPEPATVVLPSEARDRSALGRLTALAGQRSFVAPLLRMTAGGAPLLRMTTWANVLLAWAFYATIWAFLAPGSDNPLALPERALEPFRIANAYGLFATMTQARYEIEFQGSNDGGGTWVAYPFRYKAQNVDERPGIYAPYQPRFDWNLWFASLGPWQQSTWVVEAQMRLVQGSREVLSLFRDDPFHGHPPAQVRTVPWQYWFTDEAAKSATGAWWRRSLLGVYAGTVSRTADGRLTFEPDPNAVVPSP